VLVEAEDLAHLVDGLDRVVRRLGGLTRRWRFDRMATVCSPATGRLTASFAGVAEHYGVGVDLCPARHGNRKGVVEKANHAAAQRWWRTLPDDVPIAGAQASLDRLCVRLDERRRTHHGGPRWGRWQRPSRCGRSDPSPTRPPWRSPAGSPRRPWSASAATTTRSRPAWRAPVTVRARLGASTLELRTAAGVVIACHQRATDGAGVMIRDPGHVAALERVVLAGFSDRPPCRRKLRRPPSAAAQAEAARLRGQARKASAAEHVVVDLGAYAHAAAADHHPASQPALPLESDQEPR